MTILPVQDLEDQLVKIGLPARNARTFSERRQYSRIRIEEIKRNFERKISKLAYSKLAIYAAGSFARGEASKYSDVDLFFVHDDRDKQEIVDANLRQIQIMSEVIENVQYSMGMPPPSNDGEFLTILSLNEMLDKLGGKFDDYENHFTTRMLLLLESSPIIGLTAFDGIVEALINSYFRDYENHAENFRTTFLANDILRFWKTLCLNYEHRRNFDPQARKTKQKIKNFKLGYSRLMTCFATIALLSSYNNIDKAELIEICKLSPIDRLLMLANRNPHVTTNLKEALFEYHWFLEKTDQPTSDLENYFNDKNNKIDAFKHSEKFGDAMYKIVKQAAEETHTLRYLVI